MGISKAKTENDQQYIHAYCNPNDNAEHVWLYWMAGATGAILPFSLLGTAAIVVIMERQLRDGKHDTEHGTNAVEVDRVGGDAIVQIKYNMKPKEYNFGAAVVAIASTMLLLSSALLCSEYSALITLSVQRQIYRNYRGVQNERGAMYKIIYIYFFAMVYITVSLLSSFRAISNEPQSLRDLGGDTKLFSNTAGAIPCTIYFAVCTQKCQTRIHRDPPITS